MERRSGIFEADTDVDLLAYVAMAEDDRAGAERAFEEFYHRHVSWLYETIRRNLPVSRLLGGREGIEDVIQETFRRAFEKAQTFDSGGETDPDQLRRAARAWLGGIAKNLVWDITQRGVSLPSEVCVPWEEESDPRSPDSTASGPDSARVALLRPFLAELSPLDQDILAASASYYQPRAAVQRLPSGVCRALARRWKTTPENIRQRRHRLYQRIRGLLEHVAPTGDGSNP